jgi:hypothetical protein
MNTSHVPIGCGTRAVPTRPSPYATAAWWIDSRHAPLVAQVARQDGGDIPAAARALGVRLTEHRVVVQRVTAASARLDERLAWAQRSGLLSEFNREYRRRRLAARAAGESFMPYRAAELRLRNALVDVAAGKAPGDMIARVFDDRRPDPQ